MSGITSDDRYFTRGKSRQTSGQQSSVRNEPLASQQSFEENSCWDELPYDEQDEAASNRARRLLKRSRQRLPRFQAGRRLRSLREFFASGRWARRIALTVLGIGFFCAMSFALLWWRLGTGPINFDIATPWLAAAMEDNFGGEYDVEVGGTQIERAGRIRIAVRLHDIVVRDHDQRVVASAPKAEVRISGTSLLLGHLRAESLNLVGAELSVRIAPDGQVTVSASSTRSSEPDSKPITLPAAVAAVVPSSAAPTVTGATPQAGAPSATPGRNGLTTAIDWLDRLSATGLDGYDLNELGLKSGSLVVDDQQSGRRWNFQDVSLSVRRPLGGGVEFSIGEDSRTRPWELEARVGAPKDGVRSIELRADKVSTKDLLLAMRMNDISYDVDIPFSARIKGEIARDGLPTFLNGKIVASRGVIVDRKVPDYPMPVDQAEINMDWDSTRRALIAPFQIISGFNRITLAAEIRPPGDDLPNWQVGIGGTSLLLAGAHGEDPVAFNNVAATIRFDTANKKILMTQANVSNGDVGIGGTASIDYSTSEPRLIAGITATPMPASVLKRIWPVVITPELRQWIVERVDRGQLQRMDMTINAPMNTLARDGPPIPDDGMSINFIASNVTIHPVDELPPVHDADLRAHISGRTATVNIAQALLDTPGGRKMTISDYVFEIADMAPKPMQSRAHFRIDGPVPAAAEILSSDRLRDFSALPVDPATSKGTVSAQMTLALPIKAALTADDTTYNLTADLNNFSAEKVAMGQKLEASNLKVQASNQGFLLKGDVKIASTPASLEYTKAGVGADPLVRIQTTLDDAARARLGLDTGGALSGPIALKMTGKLSTSGDRDNRFNVDADLTAAKIDNALPGWVKPAGRTVRAQFSVAQKPQSTRFDDIVIDGSGTSMRGSVELDQNNDLMTAVFPTYQPSGGDRASLKADRGTDGTVKLTMRGDVFDGQTFVKSAVAGGKSDSKQKSLDIDVDVKLGAVTGAGGEAARNVEVKLSRRAGVIRSFSLAGKLGRDANLSGDLRAGAGGREVLYIEAGDAGAFFRFNDSYQKIFGGTMWMAMDPPTADQAAQEGLINVRNFTVRGETALDRAANGGNNQNGVSFTLARAEFTRQSGELAIRDGVVQGPAIGATISGNISYASNQVNMHGTFVPLFGINNMFGQIPVLGFFLGGGSNEGLVGITYDVVGPPSSPTLRVNPISAIAPGFTRKIFDLPNQQNQMQPLNAPQ